MPTHTSKQERVNLHSWKLMKVRNSHAFLKQFDCTMSFVTSKPFDSLIKTIFYQMVSIVFFALSLNALCRQYLENITYIFVDLVFLICSWIYTCHLFFLSIFQQVYPCWIKYVFVVEWLCSLYKQQWECMLLAYQGLDSGPEEGMTEEEFDELAFRCGRILDSDMQVGFILCYVWVSSWCSFLLISEKYNSLHSATLLFSTVFNIDLQYRIKN